MDKEFPKNAHISNPFNIAEGVAIRMVIEDGLAFGQTVLVIDHLTNYDSISINRQLIKKFALSLESQLGSDLNFRYSENLYALLQWHKKRISWMKLTMILNYLSFALIFGAYSSKTNIQEISKVSEEFQEIIDDPSFVDNLGGIMLIILFFTFRLSLEDFSAWMKSGYESLANGRIGSLNYGPFDKYRIINHVNYFHDRIREGKMFISERDSQWNALEHIIYVVSLKGYFTEIDNLLDKEGKEDWKQYKSFLQNWRFRIIKKWEGSRNPKIIKYREFYRKNCKTA